MKIIIDTHIFLWLLAEPKKIGQAKLKLLEDLSNTIYLSSISIAELMIKSSIGKLEIDFNPKEIALISGCELLDFTACDALLLKDMPFHHKDPFDRMIIAQAIANDYFILSNDLKFNHYDCKLI